MNDNDLSRRDLAVLWHPCTQMKDHESTPPIAIRRGEGAWLEDYDGRRYLDAISSWWVNLFGHAQPRIAAAIAAQATQLEQVILAGFTHEPIVRLSERLVALAPPGLARCHYASDGSSAVEIALKLCFQYFRNRGETRPRFIALASAYHGETLGALAVGDVGLYRETFAPLLMQPLVVPGPDNYLREPGESPEQMATRAAARMEAMLAEHAHDTCAVIVEPLVQCAGGMRMYHASYLRQLRALCDRYGVLLIADEIAVGFGRTGTLFACEQAGIAPDCLLLGKGLTGGFLPLSVCLTTEKIYNTFYDDYTSGKAFLHSHSYSGNPLACAAANATLDLFAETDVLAANRTLAQHMAASAAALADHPRVADMRQTGMILAVEFVKDKATREPWPWQERRGLRLQRHALSRGVLLRPLGPVAYLMPPYVITPAEIDLALTVLREGIDVATRD
jgi:adenosylmethionine-8-amino-7-oxononanoate aminotransferase